MKLHKFWKSCLVGEILLSIAYFVYDFDSKKKFAVAQKDELMGLIAVLAVCSLVILFYKRFGKNVITRWPLLLILMTLFQFCWGGWFLLAIKVLPKYAVWIAVVFYVIYVFLFFPIIRLIAGEIRWTISRIIFTFMMAVSLLLDVALWKVKTSNQIVNTIMTSGLLAGIAFFISGCYLAHNWGFRFNPNLKFKKLSNFSFVVMSVILIYAVVDVIWNDFGGYHNGVLNLFISYGADSMKFTFKGMGEAAEAGILEETMRFLNIVVLLYAFRRRKWQIPATVSISAVLFGMLHLSNYGWQELYATLDQCAEAFGAGLFLAILYLYSGKLWLAMLEHFLLDFFIFAQTGGSSQPGSWGGDVIDWVRITVAVVVPLSLFIWMMFGRRRRVLEENAQRLIIPEIENDFLRSI